jgi:hypothetical protein
MTPQLYTLVWLLIAPVVPGGVPKDQSVYFGNKVTQGECFAMAEQLLEFTKPTDDVTNSMVSCVPVPR